MDIESEFGISKLGFLPERCIERLPDNHFFTSLENIAENLPHLNSCLLYTSPSPRDVEESRMPSSA